MTLKLKGDNIVFSLGVFKISVAVKGNNQGKVSVAGPGGTSASYDINTDVTTTNLFIM
ncbi:hypothetical protein ACO0K9_11960 [Undibacterium sp. Ji50W]|uniref:hypothetical protein n=1 Tax=Undibacterium sp. Ji50W TaxID=3413041 RepID=UPI003BF268EC